MSTTQQSTAETKRTEDRNEVPVHHASATPAEIWQADMERLMGDWMGAWSGLGRLQPFGGLLPGQETPPSNLEEWRAQADRYFADLNRRWAELTHVSPLQLFGVPAGVSLNPEVDISDGDGKFVVKADLPGLEKDDVEVQVDGDILTISGQKSESEEEKENGYCRRERRFGSFRRSFTLPEDVDGDKMKAAFDKGVLTITVPKLAAEKKSKGRKVSVKG